MDAHGGCATICGLQLWGGMFSYIIPTHLPNLLPPSIIQVSACSLQSPLATSARRGALSLLSLFLDIPEPNICIKEDYFLELRGRGGLGLARPFIFHATVMLDGIRPWWCCGRRYVPI